MVTIHPNVKITRIIVNDLVHYGLFFFHFHLKKTSENMFKILG